MAEPRSILVAGGAGYVGAVLVPRLLQQGHSVTVLDLFLYGHDVLESVRRHENLVIVEGDIRHPLAVNKAVASCDTVIHLACISNDPSFDLDPELGKSINHDAFRPLIHAAKAAGVSRFVYASSSSVYGVKEEEQVTEDLSVEPITDYSRYKVLCEEILEQEREPGFATLTIRPATVCGYSPRQRMDLIVNILANHAINNRAVKVFGGAQARPNIHVDDMARAYEMAVSLPDAAIDGKVFNVGGANASVMELAETVRETVSSDSAFGGDIGLDIVPTNDHRSYRVTSQKIADEWGFVASKTAGDAVRDLIAAFKDGRLSETMTDKKFSNIETMKSISMR